MDGRRVLGIDIGASKTLLTMRPIEAHASAWVPGDTLRRTATPADPDALVDWIEGCVIELGAAGLAAVGVAAPGPVDHASAVITRSSNLGWQDVPIGALLGGRLDTLVALEDDANTAALGEWWFGAGERADPFAYLTLSSGIGGGIVVGGSVVRGAKGNAGEVGHIVIDPDGPDCACGRKGDVESYAGGAALERRARDAWPDGRRADGSAAPDQAAAIFEAAGRGDAAAGRLVDDARRAVAVALAAMASVLEPERVVVGGSIGLGQPTLVGEATALARDLVMSENGRSLDVRPAALGAESVLAGTILTAQRLAERG